MIIRIRDDVLNRTARMRPPGYLDEVARSGRLDGNYWVFEEEDYKRLCLKYSGTEVALFNAAARGRKGCC